MVSRACTLLFLYLLSLTTASPLGIMQDVFDRNMNQERTKRERFCAKIKCVGAGEDCLPVIAKPNILPVCIQNSTCTLSPSPSPDYTAICVAYAPKNTLGGSCTSGSDCYSGFCAHGVCNQGFWPGTPCKSNNECLFYGNATSNPFPVTWCNNHKCAGIPRGYACVADTNECDPSLTCGPDNTCIDPLTVGDTCQFTKQCRSDLYCNDDGVCTAPLPPGAECNVGTSTCGGATTCTPTSGNFPPLLGRCIDAYSQPAGSYCMLNSHCGEGLLCNTTDIFSGNSNWLPKCQTVSPSSFKPCYLSGANTCNAGEECECNYNDGNGACIRHSRPNPLNIESVYKGLIDCQLKCVSRVDVSCLAKYCKTPYCEFTDDSEISQLLPDCVEDIRVADSRLSNPFYGFFTCDKSQNKSSYLWIAGIIILVLTVVSILGGVSFFLYKKRRTSRETTKDTPKNSPVYIPLSSAG